MLARLLLLSLLVLLAACASTQGARVDDAPLDTSPLIFSLGTTKVTADVFTRRMQTDIGAGVAELLSQGQTREQIEQLALDTNVRGSVLDRMLQDALLLDYARRNGIGVDPAGIDASAPAPVLPDPDTAAAPGLTPTQTIAEQRATLAREQQILEVIAQNTRADMFHARHILVADEAAADQLLADLAAGADFVALARERSTDQDTAANGGDLGWMPDGDFVPQFAEQASTVALNTPVKLQSDFGWHVIEVLEREAQRSFESFQQLQQSPNAQTFFDQSFTPWYDEFRLQAEANGLLTLNDEFDLNSIPLPFPEGTP